VLFRSMAQWDRKRPEGRALGVAYNIGGEWNAPIAEVVEVSLDKATGAIKVHKVWAAIDPAVAVQPKHLVQQIETGIIWGLSAALRERITIKVHKVWAAIDPAVAVQPKHLMAQIETGIIWGVSAALRERITIRNGEVQESNFHDYPVPRMNEIPDIEIKIVDSGVVEPSGAGQIGVPPIAPAIANAFYRLTGVRLRAIPMLPERVRTALAESGSRAA
jgi:isoquinoline 1-oxidoreductase beta subunit